MGFATWRLRRRLQRKPDTDPPHMLIDSIRHSVFFAGFRSPSSRTRRCARRPEPREPIPLMSIARSASRELNAKNLLRSDELPHHRIMVNNMKIFVTGHRGFIGAHLVDVLKQEGHTVVGCDLRLFEGCNWEPLVEPDRELIKDVRTIEARDLDGCDCVMHLAAISNDPMGELDAQLTFDINRDASIRLAKIAKRAGVPRFLFAGSCSIYGKGEKLDLDEDDPLNPLTAYATVQDRDRAGRLRAGRRVASPRSTCATPRPMATRRCCGSTWWSTTCWPRPCPTARSASSPTARPGGR